jgi:transcriptional regulator with XRE-family HTH domain
MSSRGPATPASANGHFGPLLRHWRQVRRLSQLDMASAAGISVRHLCFLERGRAQPSRDMAWLLGAALDLPLAERNALGAAAGFVPRFTDHPAEAEDLQPVRQAFDFILRQQEPFPGLVIDGGWDIRLRNGAAERIFAPFRAAYAMPPALAGNAMHVVFHPHGLRPFITNWIDFAGQLLELLHREVALGHAAARRLREEVMAYPDLPAGWHRPGQAVTAPVVPMRLAMGALRLAFFSTITVLAMPTDAALQTLKIECLHPADAQTAATARRLAA